MSWPDVLIYFAILLAVVTMLLVKRRRRVTWPHAKATVLVQRTQSGDMVIGFEVPGHGKVEARLTPPEEGGPPLPGTVIRIAYDPAEPSRVTEAAPPWLDTALLMLCALMGLLGLIIFLAD